MNTPTLTSGGTWTTTEGGLTFRLTAALRVRHDQTGMHIEQAWQCLETRAVRWSAVPEDGNGASTVRDEPARDHRDFGGTIDQSAAPVAGSTTGPDTA